MRRLLVAVTLMLAACASGGVAERDPESAPSPFPVERGSAPLPPTQGPGQTAPPEGIGPAGVDFGQWRSADPVQYAPVFAAQIRRRTAGRAADAIQADLEANGFACENGERLDCRIEIMERQCAFDWYVVLERGRAEPAAGFDVMCLGAR